MKFFSALTFTASSLVLGTVAAPAPEPASVGATVSPYSITCAGFNTGSPLSIGDIKWALSNRRDELDLKAGWWNQQDLICVSTLWNLAALFTGGHIGLTHMLLLVPAVFVSSVIMPTRILSLLPSPAAHPQVEIFWPVVLLGFGTTVASSWALTNQGPTLLIWVPVYCFTFGVAPYLLQLVLLKFPSCALRIATLLAWILVVESLSAIEWYGWSESLTVRHRSTVCLVLAETFAYAMQWVEWPPEDPSAI